MKKVVIYSKSAGVYFCGNYIWMSNIEWAKQYNKMNLLRYLEMMILTYTYPNLAFKEV